jgi:hypothetical protein
MWHVWWEKGSAYRGLVGKPVGRILLGRQRNRWEDMKMDPNKAGWDGVDWIHLDKDKGKRQAILKIVMNLWVPQSI